MAVPGFAASREGPGFNMSDFTYPLSVPTSQPTSRIILPNAYPQNVRSASGAMSGQRPHLLPTQQPSSQTIPGLGLSYISGQGARPRPNYPGQGQPGQPGVSQVTGSQGIRLTSGVSGLGASKSTLRAPLPGPSILPQLPAATITGNLAVGLGGRAYPIEPATASMVGPQLTSCAC
jgi:hypothetical protein